MSFQGLYFTGISPLHKIIYRERKIYVKRDDLIHPFINGNKARKLQYLFDKSENEINHLISWGGSQSNAMYALSCLSKFKKWSFSYYTRQIDPFVKKNAVGNLKYALENDMILHELPQRDYLTTINSLGEKYAGEKLHIVPMGAQSKHAEPGIKQLALELYEQIAKLNLKVCNPVIFLSSGTGTTAAYLAAHMPDFQVYTVACVGSPDYLKKQIRQICVIPENLTILESPLNIPFARPHKELHKVYQELLDSGIEFDLVYDTHLWLTIKENLKNFINNEIIFIHSGGVHGNAGQLQRYRYQGII